MTNLSLIVPSTKFPPVSEGEWVVSLARSRQQTRTCIHIISVLETALAAGECFEKLALFRGWHVRRRRCRIAHDRRRESRGRDIGCRQSVWRFSERRETGGEVAMQVSAEVVENRVKSDAHRGSLRRDRDTPPLNEGLCNESWNTT